MVKSDKHSIREAKVVAAFVTLGCLVFFIQVAGPQKQPPPRSVNSLPLPVLVPTPQPAMNYPDSGKFMVKDLTQLGFRYHEKDFLSTTTKFISTDEVDVKLYKRQIYINE